MADYNTEQFFSAGFVFLSFRYLCPIYAHFYAEKLCRISSA